MRTRLCLSAVVVSLAAMVVASSVAVADELPVPPAPAATGSITGTVSFKGTAPVREKLRRDSDPVCAATEAFSEDVVVNKGKLAGVLVRIKNGTAGTHAAPSAPAVLIQDKCTYAPRVIGIVAGQQVAIRNGDPTFHNVRGNLGDKTLFNLPHAKGAGDIIRDNLGKAGDIVDMNCDVHPWMRSFVAIHDHPFFTVTGDSGAFTLTGLPEGKYTVEAWHPVLGLKSTTVTIGKGKKAKAKASFAFKAKAK